MDKVFYNKSSADSLGWEPEWFGAEYHDENLVRAIKAWQKKNGLTADGLCGPSTYRRIWTERDASVGLRSFYQAPDKDQSYVVCNSELVEIDWPKVVLWNEPGGLKAKPGNYYDYGGKKPREVNMFVNHWDVCLSAESCAKVLNRRGISVHFNIDNDGTIYQLLDTQHGAWHAGNSNHKSIGVEISNGYYLKYQDWYVKNGFGERPVIENATIRGKKMKPFLGFYPVQLEAVKALWMAMHKGWDIPLVSIESGDSDFMTSDSYDARCSRGNFKGFVSHYHQTSKKIDCAGLDIVKMLRELAD